MATNKFASFLHKNTNKFTLILIYTLLEWILIILLLTNSLLSYFIVKFADYFGLKTPCPLCSRIDHLLEPGKGDKLHRDLLCETHSKEISQLGYCSNHKKFAKWENLCGECSFSEREKVDGFSDVGLECSCCGLSLERENYSPCIVIKPSLDILDYTKNGNFVEKARGFDDQIEIGDDMGGNLFEYSIDSCQYQDGKEKKGENQIISEENYDEEHIYSVFGGNIEAGDSNSMIKDPSFSDNLAQIGDKEGASADNLSHHLEFFVGCDGFRLIPIELIDSAAEESQGKEKGDGNCEKNRESFDFQIKFEEGFEMGEEKEEDKFAVIETMDIEENTNSLNFRFKENEFLELYNGNEDEEKGREWEPNVFAAKEELQIPVNEADAEVSIGTEIPDLDIANDIQNQENLCMSTYIDGGCSVSFSNSQQTEINGVGQAEEEPKELNTISIDAIHNVMNFKMSSGSELSDIEEDKIPDTPTSIYSLHQLHKKLLMLEKRESGGEESLDGSLVSELDGDDGVPTIDGLKLALKAERKALRTLYTELEEERSASAIAANQTMAMITRLQEQKAVMQMESLQYQRMMEEQSEYDQEALQLLNELMVKREKEKQELQRELEVYRKKVLEYEEKEKFRLSRSSDESVTSDSFSGSSSNNGDSFGHLMDLNVAPEANDGCEHENGIHSTPVDAVLDSESALDNFQEESISILEQLKALEEKLFSMSEDEKEHFEDIKPIEHFYEENGEYPNGLENGFHRKTNGNIDSEGRIKGVKGKRLAPLFDEMNDKEEERIDNGHVNGFHFHDLEKCHFQNGDMEIKRNGIAEEVDRLYGRLQALQEDNEFLKHCISSLKKGEKGIDLLQEILQHLRDLRNVELHVRNLGDPKLV